MLLIISKPAFNNIVSASDGIAGKRALGCKEHIEKNQELRRVFPYLRPQWGAWGKTQLTVQRSIIDVNPSIEASGILSTATGDRADILWVDDPVDEKNAIINPALIPKVIDSFYNVWMNLLSPSSQVIVICTPWHQKDLIHDLVRNPEFAKLTFRIDDSYTSVWKAKWPKSALKKKERTIGKRAFARGFKLQVLSDDEQLFGDISKCKDDSLFLDDVRNKQEWLSYMGVDLAISKRKGSAYTVLFIIRVNHRGKRIVCDIIRGKWGSVTTAALILAFGSMYNCEDMKVENNAYQDSILEWINLLKERGLPTPYDEDAEEKMNKFYSETLSKDINIIQWNLIKDHLLNAVGKVLPISSYLTTGKSIADEQIGLPSLAAEIQNGDWIIPWADHDNNEEQCQCNICTWINEMLFYPIGTYKDCVMASFFAARAAKISGGRIRQL